MRSSSSLSTSHVAPSTRIDVAFQAGTSASDVDGSASVRVTENADGEAINHSRPNIDIVIRVKNNMGGLNAKLVVATFIQTP